MKLFVSPHNDDAALFGAFAIQKERPLVFTVFASQVQVDRGHAACDASTRMAEDLAAMKILGVPISFGGVLDSETDPMKLDQMIVHVLSQWNPSEVWLPLPEPDGHDHHNRVGLLGAKIFSKAKLHYYLTYTRSKGRSTEGTKYQPTGAMVRKKLQALACYQTQLEIDALGCWPHFMDLNEYYREL